MLAKLATLGLLKITAIWNKGYDVIIFAHNVTNKILSLNLNCIVDVVLWPKFGNSSILQGSKYASEKDISSGMTFSV